MNNPAKIRFGAWRKPEVEFTLLDWRPREGLASVVDADKRRQVIRFVLPGLLAQGGVGLRVALPRAAPTTITETCLLPPPCRTIEKEADCLRAAAAEAGSPNSRTKSRNSPDLPNWELVWLRHRSEVLLPAPDDHAALAKQLEVFKANQRRAYDACRQELEDWRTKSIGQMICLGGGRFYRELRNCKPAAMPEEVERRISSLENLHMRPLSESMGRLHGGWLNWTPEMAKHEALIRDPVLCERWATQHHLKLAEMNADKKAFLIWYRAHCPAPMPRASGGFLDVLAPGARVASADMALAAEVRFLAHFSDGSRVWLADCPRRDPLLTVEEQRPFETPLPPATLAGQALDSTAARTEHVQAPLVGPSRAVASDEASPSHQKQTVDVVQAAGTSRTEVRKQTTRRRSKPSQGARFENDFSLARIPQPGGEPLPITIEQELQALLKRIIEAGGQIPRTKLREGKADNYQPEKLLRSKAAKALLKAGLLGSHNPSGRTTVYWAKLQSD